MLIPDVVARRSVEFIMDFEQKEFCERYVPMMRGSELERIRQCAASNGWTEGTDYLIGHRSILCDHSRRFRSIHLPFNSTYIASTSPKPTQLIDTSHCALKSLPGAPQKLMADYKLL